MAARLKALIEEHEDWRLGQCLNLIPSENVASRQVRALLASDLGNRYCSRFYRGGKLIEKVEELAKELARKVFEARHACLRPLSGHVAGMAMLLALTKQGDRLLATGEADGGYGGYTPSYLPRKLGVKADMLPFDRDRFNLNYERCEEKIENEKPALVVLGASFILFPYNIARIRRACDRVGAYLGYDASHVLGLIAGGMFQAPLREGVDMLVGSTHKSFFGPQGGLILTSSDELNKKLEASLEFYVVDNPHWHRVAGLAQALAEAEAFGRTYAERVVRNAQALARSLDEGGFPVRYRELGYTRSHQVLVDTEAAAKNVGGGYVSFAERSEAANIIVDTAGRLGVQELTRWGMKEKEMASVAELLCRLLKGETPESVRKDATELKRQFNSLKYVFE
ncbi:MAG: serine hydroxymethyltransferase [Candidatus Bathyarchaeia archaeon]